MKQLLSLFGMLAASMLPIAIHPSPAIASETVDIYAVVVGSSHYAAADDPAWQGFPEIRGANKSARRVAGLLADGGARFVLQLTSSTGRYVSRADVYEAVKEAVALTKSAEPKQPLLLFYFAGHGISEGAGGKHFSVPGDTLSEAGEIIFAPEGLRRASLSTSDLISTFIDEAIPHLLILDNCFEGTALDFDIPVLPPSMDMGGTMLVKEFVPFVADAMDQVLKQMRGADVLLSGGSLERSPVLFAAKPRHVVKTAPDPRDPRAAVGLAPQARRLTLVADPLRQSFGALTIEQALRSLTDPRFDPETEPAYTEYNLQEDSRVLLDFRTPGKRGHVVERLGTATSPQPCCEKAIPPLQRQSP